MLLQIPVELRAGKGRIPPEVLANPSLLRFPPINPRFRLVILRVAVFLLVRRVATPEIAIGAGFFTSLIVFFVNRQIGRIGIPAVLGMVIVGGPAIVRLVLGSEKAYLMMIQSGTI